MERLGTNPGKLVLFLLNEAPMRPVGLWEVSSRKVGGIDFLRPKARPDISDCFAFAKEKVIKFCFMGSFSTFSTCILGIPQYGGSCNMI